MRGGGMDHDDYYAEAFRPQRGRCFRMVLDPEPRRGGHAANCTAPVLWRGTFVANNGKRYTVDTCQWHAKDLKNRVPSGQRSNGNG